MLSSTVPRWPRLAKATTGTMRRKLINVPARLATSGRRITLHLPTAWPWQTAWTALFDRVSDPPARLASRPPSRESDARHQHVEHPRQRGPAVLHALHHAGSDFAGHRRTRRSSVDRGLERSVGITAMLDAEDNDLLLLVADPVQHSVGSSPR